MRKLRAVMDARVTTILCVLSCPLLAFTGPAGSTEPAMLQITLEYWAPYYQPFVAVAVAETPIRWVNPTTSPHTLTHDGCVGEGLCAFASGAVAPDGSFTISRLAPGHYSYHCTLHPIMRGELVVEGPMVSISEAR